MKILIAGIATVAVILSSIPADARRGGFLSALVRGSVQGAARSGGHSYAKTYGPDTLTIDQIEKCIKFAQELDRSSEYLNAVAASINAESAAITQAQQFLSVEKDLVDRYSEASVNAYNNKLAAMRARISRHNASVDRGEGDQNAHNTRVLSYNAECAKKYYADDMEAARVMLGVKDD